MIASAMKCFLFFDYTFSILYTHFRGNDRLKFLRQLTDHSSLMAPINIVMYLFSAVPKTPYLDLEQFPELRIFKENWETIRDEALFLYQEGYIAASDKHDDIGFNSFFRKGWKRFYLKWYQDPIASAKSLCPNTLSLIEKVPNINAAMFTLLPKGSTLSKHRDPYAGSLRYHLGLVTPNSPQCFIEVDGERYHWRDGADVLFDETYLHSAQNNTDTDRIIFFCDVQRPLRSRLARGFNRFINRTIMKASASKNLPHEPVGVINSVFGYLYKIRLAAKKVKNYNHTLYSWLKYSLYIAILYKVLF